MLVVSRPDVEHQQLQSFPTSDRFIKLPIENYLKLLNIWDTINHPQLALINAVNNPKYRFICAALARRLGKTYISNVIGQLVSLIPNSNVLIVSPNYNLSSISFELQRKLIKHFDLEVTRDNLKDRVIELQNGSTIRMGSVQTIDSVVGRSYDLVIFDEAALAQGGEDAFNVALRPTLDKWNSKAIFISTPRGKLNWFSKFFQRGFTGEYGDWCSIQADYLENNRMNLQDVESARQSMSESEFNQEYMASFLQFEGQIFSTPKTIAQTLTTVDLEHMEVFAGCDPGYKDHTAFVVCGYNHKLDKFYVLESYLERGKTTQEHANQFRALMQPHGCDIVFIDSAAAQFAADLAYLYDISTTKAKKDVLPGIAYIQTLLQQDRLVVLEHCTAVLSMLDQYRWDNRETLQRERPVHDQHSHIADALRYALYTYVV